MDDRRVRSRSFTEEFVPEEITSSLISLNISYKLFIPNEGYKNQIPVIVLSKPKALKYHELLNAYIMPASSNTKGKAVIYFTDIHKNKYVGTLEDRDFMTLSNAAYDRIGITDSSIFFENADDLAEVVQLKLYEREA